jgi:cytoskeletal protein RodZ
MSTNGPRRERSNGHGRRSSDLLTIDELINRIVMRARSRRGRLVLTTLGLVAAAIIVIIPLTRSAKAYSPAAAPPTAAEPPTVVSTAPSRTTLPTLPLELFAPHSTSPSSLATTTTSSSSTTSSSTTTAPTTTVAPATTTPQTAAQTAPPPGPPDTGVRVPVG